jgi:hypothetical protein
LNAWRGGGIAALHAYRKFKPISTVQDNGSGTDPNSDSSEGQNGQCEEASDDKVCRLPSRYLGICRLLCMSCFQHNEWDPTSHKQGGVFNQPQTPVTALCSFVACFLPWSS